jgi:hypothetical protein
MEYSIFEALKMVAPPGSQYAEPEVIEEEAEEDSDEDTDGVPDGYDYTNPQTGWYNFSREFF